ncbi:putative NTP pyrophosphohydrolase protein [Rhizobium phage RHph_I42]|nr:putative NTP pyrophosphohydrolase protein [Rhizobium phage RHph_I42]
MHIDYSKFINDVSAFHDITDTPNRDVPTKLSEAEIQLRCNLNREEDREFYEASVLHPSFFVAEGVDKIYVVAGTLVQMGLKDRINHRCEFLPFNNYWHGLELYDEMFLRAVQNNQLEAVVDASIAKIYLTCQILIDRKLDGCVMPMWDAIHGANMAKADPVTGKCRKREDGKVLKPEGWQPANILSTFHTWEASQTVTA